MAVRWKSHECPAGADVAVQRIKLARIPAVVQSVAHFGIPQSLIVILRVLEAGCTIVYLIPKTAVLGAILMTGYLGGAIATNLRVGDSVVIPALLGMLAWGGLYLQDNRIRALIPLREM
jgi:hypothetical protein